MKRMASVLVVTLLCSVAWPASGDLTRDDLILLGLMYRMGQGVPRDNWEAEIWIRKAAEQGHDDAQSNLGVMYGTGTAVSQDYVLAHMWFSLAAGSGNETGRNNRDLLSKQMTPQQIAEARRLAREWKPKNN